MVVYSCETSNNQFSAHVHTLTNTDPHTFTQLTKCLTFQSRSHSELLSPHSDNERREYGAEGGEEVKEKTDFLLDKRHRDIWISVLHDEIIDGWLRTGCIVYVYMGWL